MSRDDPQLGGLGDHVGRLGAASDDEVLDALAATLLRRGARAVVLTGAGVSAGSAVPTFRAEGGLWDRYDPEEFATLEALRRDPARVWSMLRELDGVLRDARPNPAHLALAALERLGLIGSVVTQNVDSLHQAAGNREVIELHGSGRRLGCLDCGRTVRREELRDPLPRDEVPRCADCGGVLRPDVVFFGEPLPADAAAAARRAIADTGDLIVVGTSAEVEPAASLPRIAARAGTRVWEVNPEPALRVERVVARPAEDALPDLVDRVRRRLRRHPLRWLLGR